MRLRSRLIPGPFRDLSNLSLDALAFGENSDSAMLQGTKCTLHALEDQIGSQKPVGNTVVFKKIMVARNDPARPNGLGQLGSLPWGQVPKCSINNGHHH